MCHGSSLGMLMRIDLEGGGMSKRDELFVVGDIDPAWSVVWLKRCTSLCLCPWKDKTMPVML